MVYAGTVWVTQAAGCVCGKQCHSARSAGFNRGKPAWCVDCFVFRDANEVLLAASTPHLILCVETVYCVVLLHFVLQHVSAGVIGIRPHEHYTLDYSPGNTEGERSDLIGSDEVNHVSLRMQSA